MPLPTQAQLALAIVLLKHKPFSIDMDGYLLHLRQSSRSGRIDTAAFWIASYNALDKRARQNIDEIHKLKIDIDGCRQKVLDTQLASQTKKRGIEWGDGRPPKRTKGEGQHQMTRNDIISSLLDNGTSDEDPLAGCISWIGFTLSQQPIRSRNLRDAIVHSCVSAGNRIRSQLKQLAAPISKGKQRNMSHASTHIETEQALAKIGSVLRCSIKAISRLDAQSDALPQAVHATITLFASFLDALHIAVLPLARSSVSRHESAHGSLSKHPPNTKRMKTGSAFDENICAFITTILVETVGTLDVTTKTHESLITGITCNVLDHIGTMLSTLTFGGITRENKCVGMLLPSGLENQPSEQSKLERAAAMAEAPFLVFVLQELMGILKQPSLLNCTQKSIQKGQTLPYLRTRLQNTLLRGIFGDEEDFINALQYPKALPFKNMVAKPGSNLSDESPEWFIQRVWDLVGWDVLASSHMQSPAPSAPGSQSDIQTHSFIERDSQHQPVSTTTSIDPPASLKTCYCRGVASGRMVECSSSTCHYGIYHLECIGLKRVPKDKANWLCASCRRQT